MTTPFDVVRTRAALLNRWPLSKGARGATLRAVEVAIESAADSIGLSLCARMARLKLAEEVYEKPCTSYNQLNDNELYALMEWTRDMNAVRDWLKANYGYGEQLMEPR